MARGRGWGWLVGWRGVWRGGSDFTAELGMREVDSVLEKGISMSTMFEKFPPSTKVEPHLGFQRGTDIVRNVGSNFNSN